MGGGVSVLGEVRYLPWRALRHVKAAVDCYLSRFVFPHEMKEFPRKLSASGWDIARAKVQPTTGFSGTNDSRYVLPLSIEQRDRERQRHTNSLVLQQLLRPENDLHPAAVSPGAGSLLDMLAAVRPDVRVLLDVGAQVLELRNDEVAMHWLRRVPALGSPSRRRGPIADMAAWLEGLWGIG